MQRNGNEQIGVAEELAARLRHPRRERTRCVGAVAVLEGEDEPAADVVIGDRRAGPPERPRGRCTRRAHGSGDDLEFERHAACRA